MSDDRARRWRLLLVSYLLDGPKRFSDLRRDMPGISQRMLTLDLRALEDAGLVRRTVYPEVPVRVEYDLSADGDRLRPVVETMREPTQDMINVANEYAEPGPAGIWRAMIDAALVEGE